MNRFLVFFLFVLLCSKITAQQNNVLFNAKVAYGNKEYTKAAEYYSKALKEVPAVEKHMIYYQLGMCYDKMGEFKKAEKYFLKSLKISVSNPKYKWINAYANWQLADMYADLNKKEKALSYLIKASRFSDESLLFSTIGFVQIYMGQFDSALKNLNHALFLDNKNAYAYSNRAFLYIKTNKVEQAKEDIDKSLQLNPNNPYVYKHRGMLRLIEKDREGACQDFAKANELNYKDFGYAPDDNDVDELIRLNCN